MGDAVRATWERPFVRGDEERAAVLAAIAGGATSAAAARRHGVPRTTVRDWVARARADEPARCPRCWARQRGRIVADAADYAELLGLYLGDGHIAELPRTQRLRISLDARYPVVLAESEALLRRCLPDQAVGRVVRHEGRLVDSSVHGNHLGCLLPQHGPGPKHLRVIELEPWQEALVAQAPGALLRGLVRSDGCTFVNRTGPYAYLTYDFCNFSADVLDIFCRACEHLDVPYRRTARRVRVNRRAGVAVLLDEVGVKR